MIPNLRDIPPMHKTGNVIVNDNAYIIDQCLFDSGAESDNFILQNFIDMNCDILAEFISPHKSSIRLGDSKTTVNISQIATLTVTFCDTNFVTHDAILNFLIMPITHIDMIIGINSILYFLYDFFLDLLRSAKNNIKKYNTPIAPSHLLNMRDEICISNDIPDHPHYHDCVPTFDTNIDIIAPEEDDVPEPVNFGKALYILSNTRDKILSDYYALLETNICADFVAVLNLNYLL